MTGFSVLVFAAVSICEHLCLFVCVRACVHVRVCASLTTSGSSLVARSWMAFPRMHREDKMKTTPRTTHALWKDRNQVLGLLQLSSSSKIGSNNIHKNIFLHFFAAPHRGTLKSCRLLVLQGAITDCECYFNTGVIRHREAEEISSN